MKLWKVSIITFLYGLFLSWIIFLFNCAHQPDIIHDTDGIAGYHWDVDVNKLYLTDHYVFRYWINGEEKYEEQETSNLWPFVFIPIKGEYMVIDSCKVAGVNPAGQRGSWSETYRVSVVLTSEDKTND